MFKAFLQTSSLEASMMVHALKPSIQKTEQVEPCELQPGTHSEPSKQTKLKNKKAQTSQY